MPKTISLREANQQFARVIRAVEAGEEFVVTRAGKPVARLAPVEAGRVLTPEQQAAWERTKARMAKGWPIGAEPGMRERIYADRLDELDARRNR